MASLLMSRVVAAGGEGGHTVQEIELTLPRQSVEEWTAELQIPLDRDAILSRTASAGSTVTLLIGRVRKIGS